MSADTDRPSYWTEADRGRRFPPLEEDVTTEVAVVGGGIVGVTAAYLLARAGRDVVLVDRERVGQRDTGHTTAHLSHVVDTPLEKLVEKHGEEKTGRVWEANRFAMDLIERTARAENIACDFERVDGILYAARPEDVQKVQRIRGLAERIGHPAEAHEAASVPFRTEAAIRWPHQARFHPTKYLRGLVDVIVAEGGRVHEDTPVHGLEPTGDGGAWLKLATDDSIRARHVILATHATLEPQKKVWARLHPFRSYAIGAVIPKGSFPDALFWDTLDPFHYARIQPMDGEDLLIFGGADHPVGQADDEHQRWDRLESELRRSLDIETDVVWRWSAQDARSPDLLPAIGINAHAIANERIATGFDGSGMTYGTLAAWMLAEQVQGRTTEWDDLFDPRRIDPAFDKHLASEDREMPKYSQKQRQRAIEPPQVENLARGQGAVVTMDGNVLAVHRNERGDIEALSAKCMHMGCIVDWNGAEQSWDCGCHGSRYALDGHVLDGPAPHGLHKVDERVLDELHVRMRAPRREERTR